jgi:hypothetical protein
MIKQPTGIREMLGSYPSPKLMNLFNKSFMLVRTCIVDDPSCSLYVFRNVDRQNERSFDSNLSSYISILRLIPSPSPSPSPLTCMGGGGVRITSYIKIVWMEDHLLSFLSLSIFTPRYFF